ELDHMRAIENYAKDIDRATALIAPVTKGELINLIMKGLKAELEKKAEAELDLTEAYRTGMALEKKSYNYYEQMMLKASDPKERRFFIFLMGQEETHYELLAETLQYLDKTGDWYREQERWNVD
ncbi:MAG TPA: ferritin family protein, partial [Candidatus Sulfotelmatobacter sp.]|nr:ferritin family protein [Candidatus Sulfotelmatobacter sp.]